MNPRKGEIYQCPQCGMRLDILRGCNWPTLQLTETWQCCCCASMLLLQSGSESVQGSQHGQNKIVDAAHG